MNGWWVGCGRSDSLASESPAGTRIGWPLPLPIGDRLLSEHPHHIHLIGEARAAMLLARPLAQPAAGGLLRLPAPASPLWEVRWTHAAGQLQQCAAYSSEPAPGDEVELPPPSGPLVGIKVCRTAAVPRWALQFIGERSSVATHAEWRRLICCPCRRASGLRPCMAKAL